MEKKLKLPAAACIFCQKTIEEVGGRRLVGTTKGTGYGVYERKIGGGSKDRPFRSIKFPDTESKYLVVWGKQWTPESMQRALETIQSGKLPWFCQKCGYRQCSVCGEPIIYPVASDVIYDTGCITHCMIIPADLGCINPKCRKYRDLNKDSSAHPAETDEKIDKPKKLYWIGSGEAMKIMPGKSRIKYRERIGTISTKPEYRKYVNHGFWYAEVRWDDGKHEKFNLNRMGVEIEP